MRLIILTSLVSLIILFSCNKRNDLPNQFDNETEIVYQTSNFSDDTTIIEIVQLNRKLERNGLRKIYEQGILTELSEYRRDTLEGFSISFDQGKPVEFGFFKNHKVNGSLIEFSNDGEKIIELKIENDKVIDTIAIWKLVK